MNFYYEIVFGRKIQFRRAIRGHVWPIMSYKSTLLEEEILTKSTEENSNTVRFYSVNKNIFYDMGLTFMHLLVLFKNEKFKKMSVFLVVYDRK